MKCPIDSATLVMTDRSGVEIDYCPECRGVWLDRGELDKIIDRAEGEFAASTRAAPASDRGSGSRDRHDSDGGYRGKKKESWMRELFD